LIIEVHHEPDKALSDGMQSLYPDQFDELMSQVRQIAGVVGRTVAAASPRPDAVSSVSSKPTLGSSAAPLT
jgi:3-deoxy-7-phosphoheptulonate synthase